MRQAYPRLFVVYLVWAGLWVLSMLTVNTAAYQAAAQAAVFFPPVSLSQAIPVPAPAATPAITPVPVDPIAVDASFIDAQPFSKSVIAAVNAIIL